MHLLLVVPFLFNTSFFSPFQAQSLTAAEIVSKSIEYHDPKGLLLKKNVTLYLTETRPNGSDRKSEISFNIKKEKFQLSQLRDDHTIVSSYDCGKVTFLLDGEKEISDSDKEKFRLDEKRVETLKNYYQYLWLMPLKLVDAGSNFNPLIERTEFFGKESLQIRVTYDPSVGSDVWYFYFNPTNYALQGYRFYHDEVKNDGEYILLEGETTFAGVRLPKIRKWYTHKEDKYLGSDILDKMSF